MSYKINNSQYVTEHNIGDWGGDEKLAAHQFNKILDAIAKRLHEDSDDVFEAAKKTAFDQFGSDVELLEYTNEQIDGVFASMIASMI